MLARRAARIFYKHQLVRQPGTTKARRKEKSARKTAFLGRRWKLIHDRDSGEFEVYDLQVDPADLENLWGMDPDRDAVLQRELLKWETQAYQSKPKPPGE
jgi:hypothetical protein